MIKEFDPTVENVLIELFGFPCVHKEMDVYYFCPKCKRHIKITEINKIKELDVAINSNIENFKCGFYIGKLFTFLSEFATLRFTSKKDESWHGFCLEVPKSQGTIYLYSREGKSVGYNVCWLSGILFSFLLESDFTKEELWRIINEE